MFQKSWIFAWVLGILIIFVATESFDLAMTKRQVNRLTDSRDRQSADLKALSQEVDELKKQVGSKTVDELVAESQMSEAMAEMATDLKQQGLIMMNWGEYVSPNSISINDALPEPGPWGQTWKVPHNGANIVITYDVYSSDVNKVVPHEPLVLVGVLPGETITVLKNGTYKRLSVDQRTEEEFLDLVCEQYPQWQPTIPVNDSQVCFPGRFDQGEKAVMARLGFREQTEFPESAFYRRYVGLIGRLRKLESVLPPYEWVVKDSHVLADKYLVASGSKVKVGMSLVTKMEIQGPEGWNVTMLADEVVLVIPKAIDPTKSPDTTYITMLRLGGTADAPKVEVAKWKEDKVLVSTSTN